MNTFTTATELTGDITQDKPFFDVVALAHAQGYAFVEDATGTIFEIASATSVRTLPEQPCPDCEQTEQILEEAIDTVEELLDEVEQVEAELEQLTVEGLIVSKRESVELKALDIINNTLSQTEPLRSEQADTLLKLAELANTVVEYEVDLEV